jgi:energy-coupling factor transporter ATP-binding protein EcfA2
MNPRFNFEKLGRPLCKIEGGQFDNQIIYLCVDDKEQPKHPFTRMNFAEAGQKEVKLQQVPNTKSEREILYITGASGSGKSTYTRKYCEQYKKKWPMRDIYLFSSLKEDESLDAVKPKRIAIDERLIDDPIEPEALENSLVIFDDIDVLSDKKQREAVMKIANQVLEIGRHFGITAVFTNHLPTNRGDTRRVLNESHEVIYFPHSGTAMGTKRLLECYVGLDPDQMKKIRKMPTRWACIFKNYPMVIMTERSIELANLEDDSDSE